MRQFIITDTHFGASADSAMFTKCKRPRDYESRIISRWSKEVKWGDEDIVYHLGDVGTMPIVPLPGTKVLIKGNHDKKSDSWYKAHGWDVVCEAIEIKAYGKSLLLTHKPRLWTNTFDYNIHGHFHNNGVHKSEEGFAEARGVHNRLMALEYHGYGPLEVGHLLHLFESNHKTAMGFTTEEIEAKCYVGNRLPVDWKLK